MWSVLNVFGNGQIDAFTLWKHISVTDAYSAATFFSPKKNKTNLLLLFQLLQNSTFSTITDFQTATQLLLNENKSMSNFA